MQSLSDLWKSSSRNWQMHWQIYVLVQKTVKQSVSDLCKNSRKNWQMHWQIHVLEQETIKQSLSDLWKNSRKNLITLSNDQTVFIRKHNFQAAAELFFNQNLGYDLSAATRYTFRDIHLPARKMLMLWSFI